MPEVTPIEPITNPITPKTTETEPQIEVKAIEEVKKPDEQKTDEPKITAETTPQDSVRIAALIRKEKQLLKKAREIQEKEKKLQDVVTQYEPWREAAQLAQQNKLEAIKKLGISYDDLTQQVLNGGNLPPEVVATQKAAEIARQEIEAFKRQAEEQQRIQTQQAYANAIKQIDAEVQSIAQGSDKYLLVKTSEAYHDVTEYIENEFHKTGKIIPLEAAMEKVENEILEGVLNLAKLDKVKSQILPKEDSKSEPIVEAQPNQKITTLTHKTTASVPQSKPMTYEQKRQRAIDIFYGRS